MAGNFKNMVVVSVTTLGSRILGLVRDMLAAAFFGAGVFNTAFNFAFTLPNMFRRMLGEGALTSALIPVLSDELHERQKRGAFEFLDGVLSRTGIVLVVLTALMCGVMALGLWGVDTHADALGDARERWHLGFSYAIILMPYMILVCLAAVQAAALNVLKRFGIAALSPVWINLSMIASLGGFGWFFAETEAARMTWLCGGVLFGGVLQVLIPGVALWRQGWHPRFDLRTTPAIREVQRLLVPGLVGATILQVNVVVSRLLAMAVDDSAVTLLYLSSRLIELPLGLFTVAAITVLFPTLSSCIVEGDNEGFVREYERGLRMIWGIAIPAALGLIILREPIVDLLFRWGNFGDADVGLLAPVVALAAVGMPFYSLSTFATRGLHAHKNMKTPMRVAVWSFVVNCVLSLALMRPFGVMGLVAANLSSAAFQSFWLQIALVRNRPNRDSKSLWRAAGVIALAALGMGIVVWGGWRACDMLITDRKLADMVAVACVIPVSMLVYFWLLCRLKFQDRDLLVSLVRRMIPGARRAANR